MFLGLIFLLYLSLSFLEPKQLSALIFIFYDLAVFDKLNLPDNVQVKVVGSNS